MPLFRKFWAVYAVVLFLTLMTLSLPVIAFHMIVSRGPLALRRNIFYLHHIFSPVFFTLIGIIIRVEGREHLDRGQSYVIVGNHRSSLDFIADAMAFPGVFRFLAKQELLKIPVFGWIVGKMCLIVDRSSAMSRARSVVALKQQLAAGWSIFIFPEGSRNQTAAPLAPFYDGAFRIAIQTGSPLAVLTLPNVHRLCWGYNLQPGILRLVWDKPIPTKGLTAADILALKSQVEQTMLQHF
ncbi:MAG: lysophospholipid acyltransferase family protein [Saprospiraceae bacterium]